MRTGSEVPRRTDAVTTNEATDTALDPFLELRLMHEWTCRVPRSFSTAWEFWTYQAPLIAFEHRYFLDAILCLAALHASRREPHQWLSSEGRMQSMSEAGHTISPQEQQDSFNSTHNEEAHQVQTSPGGRIVPCATDTRSRLNLDRLALTQQNIKMLRVAQKYFERALAGQNKALPALNAETGEACYLASLCVSYAALFALGEDRGDLSGWVSDPVQWARITHGSRVVVSRIPLVRKSKGDKFH